MREPGFMDGARAPLFERLVNTERSAAREAAPLRVLDRAALIDSVLREVGRLFNTRLNPRARARPGGDYPVVDYGVPDFGGRSPASAEDREAYAAALTRSLKRFEPRLSEVRIELIPDPAEPRRLLGRLAANLHLGRMREPVSFPLLVEAGSEDWKAGAAPGTGAAGAVV